MTTTQTDRAVAVLVGPAGNPPAELDLGSCRVAANELFQSVRQASDNEDFALAHRLAAVADALHRVGWEHLER